MPKMNVNKSIHIDAKPNEIYSKISDFNHWSPWSPWLIMEEGVKVDVVEGGKSYSWEGKRVGSGNMKVTAEKENESVDYDLNFLKPWKSYAKVGFKLKPEGEGTKVSWSMDSSLPFFMFWMKKMMTAFIGMDYERGLRMLKDYVEDGKVHSELKIKGNETFEGIKYVGIKGECDIDDMGEDMASKMGKLMTFAGENNIDTAGKGLSIYHKWDMINRKASYTAAIPVNEVPASLSADLYAGEIPKMPVHTVEHKGPYKHLGNAWGLQHMMQRGKEFKGNKKVEPFEFYQNNPSNASENDLLTEIHFGVK